LLPLCGLAQSHSAFPVDVTVTRAPQPVMADGSSHLLYELHITNFAPIAIELTGLDVLGDDRSAPLASLRDAALEKVLVGIGPDDNKDKVRAIGAGRSVVLFLDLTVLGAPPALLRHRFSFSGVMNDGAAIDKTFDGPVVAVMRAPVPVLRAPLHGPGWVAVNGLSNAEHRRSLVPVDGRVWIAQRFAIDWVQLGADGRLLHGEPNANANFYGYGAQVLAVADARVCDLKDGLPENAGNNEQRAVPITLDTIAGNYLILDLGHGRFALYAHLQPGSFRVKLGDTVKVGEVLALLGNSGNSDALHLHFHLMDANSPLGAEGMPYELERFTQTGVVEDPAVVDTFQTWRPKAGAVPVVRRREFPIDNAVVSFP
jgi:hypothetical protein